MVREFQDFNMTGLVAGTVKYGNNSGMPQGLLNDGQDYIPGRAVKFENGKYSLVTTGDAESDVVGILVRNVATGQDFLNQPGNSLSKLDITVLKEGAIAVAVEAGTAAQGGQVYLVDDPGASGLTEGAFVATNTIGGGGTVITLPLSYIEFESAVELVQGTALVRIKTRR